MRFVTLPSIRFSFLAYVTSKLFVMDERVELLCVITLKHKYSREMQPVQTIVETFP